MNRPSITSPKYHVGEPMRCPACGGKQWFVGRSSAQCASLKSREDAPEEVRCDFVIELAGVIEGKSEPIRFAVNEGVSNAKI